MTMCKECGDSVGSRYHEVAHQPDVESTSLEELEATAKILDEAKDVTRYYDCGICQHIHLWEWNGDCREDENRLTMDDIPDDADIWPWEERLAADVA